MSATEALRLVLFRSLPLPALLSFLRVLVCVPTLAALLLGPACGLNESPHGISPPAGNSGKPPPKPREGMLLVKRGLFLFGATPEQIEFYLQRSRVNFRGMAEKIRRGFVSPQRPENLDDFYLHRFEVTNRQFKDFLEATGYSPRHNQNFLQHWKSEAYPDWAADFPVVWVSLEDATAYCDWAGGWVPREIEWEKAARGNDGRYFPWGNQIPDLEAANVSSNQLEPVGNRPRDVSPHQIYDMAGNAAEWTQTTEVIENHSRVIVRGGSFRASLRETLVYYRDLSAGPETRRDDLGFRCASR